MEDEKWFDGEREKEKDDATLWAQLCVSVNLN